MALANYTDLKASLAGWLHRLDVNTTASGVGVDNITDDWIALAEAELNANLRLRVMENEATLATVTSSRFAALPAGFLEPMGLWATWSAGQTPEPLRYLPADYIDRSPVAGPPQTWGIDGTNVVFDRPLDQAYTMTLRMLKAFALSEAAPTNWLLTNYPNIYLYGSLRHSSLYLMSDPRVAAWTAMYQQGLQLLEEREARVNALTTLSVDPALQRRPAPFNIYRG